MGMIGSHNLDRGDILLLFQQLTEIDVSGAASELFFAAVLSVIRFDYFFADVASARHVVGAFSPGRILEQIPDFIPNVILTPLEVIDAILLNIAYGDNLNLRPGEDGA